MIQLGITNSSPSSFCRFKFQFPWLLDNHFKSFVQDNWTNEADVFVATKSLQSRLQVWHRESFGNIFYRKQKLLNQIQGVQRALETSPCCNLNLVNDKLTDELESIALQEEAFWKQRSQDNFLALGDRNTSYFHALATVNKGRNCILGLKNEAKEFIFGSNILKIMAKDFFATLYFDNSPDSSLITNFIFPTSHLSDFTNLDSAADGKEIKNVLWSMGPNKAPGPDGYPAAFYQSCWSTVKVSLKE